jgi:3-deoxy-D-arabino-heptulosonate 7-phosphate (DAHP) synthase class II
MPKLTPTMQEKVQDTREQEQLRLAQEAALRQRSLQRTRKLQARARHRQRQQRAARLVVVGTLVEACGLLWVEDAQLEQVLKQAAILLQGGDGSPALAEDFHNGL